MSHCTFPTYSDTQKLWLQKKKKKTQKAHHNNPHTEQTARGSTILLYHTVLGSKEHIFPLFGLQVNFILIHKPIPPSNKGYSSPPLRGVSISSYSAKVSPLMSA